jgi:serine protein kinase
MGGRQEIQSLIDQYGQRSGYQALHWKGSLSDYLAIIEETPHVLNDAFQRIYRLITSYGTEEYWENKEKMTRYHFFSDPGNEGRDAVFGLERSLMHLVNIFKSASHHYGTERRILLLHGPVGSAKSTIVRLLKKGLEKFSSTPEGALYTFSWHIEDAERGQVVEPCPMHEEPLHLMPKPLRVDFLNRIGVLSNGSANNLAEGELCPTCRFYYRNLMQKYQGDLGKVLDHVRVHRLVLSEQDRIGIGTFQPKDEKNQDSTELTGDINYRKIALYGSDSDPRAFNFDGEFNVSNRGLVEFVEVLKLDVASSTISSPPLRSTLSNRRSFPSAGSMR